MDYSQIKADPVVGARIGGLYMDAEPFSVDGIHNTYAVRTAYNAFARQVNEQFYALTYRVGISVTFQNADPYADAEEMFADVRENRRLLVMRTSADQRHPVLSDDANNRLRAVHDYFGHFLTGRGFDRHGEEAAWVRHSQMFAGGPARRVMTTETRGQSSAFIWINGGREFPPQKAVLLPRWVSSIPKRWA